MSEFNYTGPTRMTLDRVGESENRGTPVARTGPWSKFDRFRSQDIDFALESFPDAIAAIPPLVLTGCQSSEILKLRWDEVDFERQ